MFRVDILIFVPEVCTEHHCTWAGNWDCPSMLPTCCSYLFTFLSFTLRTCLSIQSLFDVQQFLLHHFIHLPKTNTVESSSLFCSATSPQPIVQLNKCESKEQVVGTLEGGEGLCQGQFLQLEKNIPRQCTWLVSSCYCEHTCTLISSSTSSLSPPLISSGSWSWRKSDLLSLFSQKTVIQKKEKRGKSYRSHWFLQLLLEAKERVSCRQLLLNYELYESSRL